MCMFIAVVFCRGTRSGMDLPEPGQRSWNIVCSVRRNVRSSSHCQIRPMQHWYSLPAKVSLTVTFPSSVSVSAGGWRFLPSFFLSFAVASSFTSTTLRCNPAAVESPRGYYVTSWEMDDKGGLCIAQADILTPLPWWIDGDQQQCR